MENIEKSREMIKKMMGDAIKGEIDTEKLYKDLSESSKSTLLRGRFEFLAGEEEQHRMLLEKLSRNIFGEDIELPDSSGLPLPEIKSVNKGDVITLNELIEVIKKARAVEKTIYDMYISMSSQFDEGSPERKMLEFLAFLNMDHYIMFGRKIEKLEKFGIV